MPTDKELSQKVCQLQAAFLEAGKHVFVVEFDDLVAFAMKHDTKPIATVAGTYHFYTGPISQLAK
jgi:hypothetical protein